MRRGRRDEDRKSHRAGGYEDVNGVISPIARTGRGAESERGRERGIGEIELDLAQSIKRRQIESMRRGRKGCKGAKKERERVEWTGRRGMEEEEEAGGENITNQRSGDS